MRWPFRRPPPLPAQVLDAVCARCGWRTGTTAGAGAEVEALFREHWANCPARKIRVTGKGGIWCWKHPGCEEAWSQEWTWDDAFRGAWWHARSHDEKLRGGERAVFANAARSPRSSLGDHR